MAKSVKVAQIGELEPGKGKTIEVDGHKIALFELEGSYCAIDDTCTHVGGPLGEGELEGEVVTCPWHGAGFNVKTGEMTGPPARSNVRAYTVRIDGNEILVEFD